MGSRHDGGVSQSEDSTRLVAPLRGTVVCAEITIHDWELLRVVGKGAFGKVGGATIERGRGAARVRRSFDR